jgi:hypothetical protein
MSDRIKQVPDGDDVRELLQVLTRIFEMARRLPPGAERIAALEQIRDFKLDWAQFSWSGSEGVRPRTGRVLIETNPFEGHAGDLDD